MVAGTKNSPLLPVLIVDTDRRAIVFDCVRRKHPVQQWLQPPSGNRVYGGPSCEKRVDPGPYRDVLPYDWQKWRRTENVANLLQVRIWDAQVLFAPKIRPPNEPGIDGLGSQDRRARLWVRRDERIERGRGQGPLHIARVVRERVRIPAVVPQEICGKDHRRP